MKTIHRSDSSSESSHKDLSNGSALQQEARRSLAKLTEDGSCCIVNPYFDMMASDEELLSKDNLHAPCAKDLQSASVQTPPERIVTGAEIRQETTQQNNKRNLSKLCHVVDDSHCSKRDSLCSLDSGISSHQSSMRSGSSDKMHSRREDSVLPGFNPKSRSLMLKRQRMRHSDLHVQGTFEACPENTNGVCTASNGEAQPGVGQHVETWIENHTVPNGNYKASVVVDRSHRAKPRVPETLQEVELPDAVQLPGAGKLPNGELLNESDDQCSRGESQVTVANSANSDEPNSEQCNSKPKATVTRSGSSLSQFYVRKRAPRPHNITIVPGSTATLPACMQRRSIHAPDSPRLMDMGRGRPSSCHGQVACNKSNSLDSKDSIDYPCCAHSQCMPGNQTCSPSASFHRQARSLEDPCPCHASTNPLKTGPTTQPSNEPSHCIPASIRKLHRQDAILESISESSRINQPSRSFEEQLQSNLKRKSLYKKGPSPKRTPNTGIGQQHVNFCQELQALLPCLPKVVIGFWWKQQGCGQAVLQWIDSLKDYDGCLYNQVREHFGCTKCLMGRGQIPRCNFHLTVAIKMREGFENENILYTPQKKIKIFTYFSSLNSKLYFFCAWL